MFCLGGGGGQVVVPAESRMMCGRARARRGRGGGYLSIASMYRLWPGVEGAGQRGGRLATEVLGRCHGTSTSVFLPRAEQGYCEIACGGGELAPWAFRACKQQSGCSRMHAAARAHGQGGQNGDGDGTVSSSITAAAAGHGHTHTCCLAHLRTARRPSRGS